jgi:hypothetical protein
MRPALQFHNEFRFVVALAIRGHKGKNIGVQSNGQPSDPESKRSGDAAAGNLILCACSTGQHSAR